MNPPGSFTREERAAIQAGGWLPRTPSGRPAPSCLGAFAQAAAGPLPDSCCLPVICQVGRSACRRKGPPPISSGTGCTSWTPGLSLTPPCPRENASPTRDGSRTCPLVRHPGLSVSHVAGAQCPRNRRGALPDPVLCENRRGGPRGPQSRGGMGGGPGKSPPSSSKGPGLHAVPQLCDLGHRTSPLWAGTRPSVGREPSAHAHQRTQAQNHGHCDRSPVGRVAIRRGPSGLPSSYLQRRGSAFPPRGARPHRSPQWGLWLPAIHCLRLQRRGGAARRKRSRQGGNLRRERGGLTSG